MGYCENPQMVRVDFFRKSGKWYTTNELKFDNFTAGTESIRDTLKRCIAEQYPAFANNEYIAVCLEPYHEHQHPLMIKDWK